MKKIGGLLILMIGYLVGCSINQTISSREIKAFFEEIGNEYNFIKGSSMFKRGGPNTLVIEYAIFEPIDEKELEDCFETTKQWIIEDENLKPIQEKLKLEQITQINIRFVAKERVDTYTSYYYKPGPYGHQDNRYWTDENVDGFETWSHETSYAYYLEPVE